MTDAFPREQLGLAMGTNTMVAAIGLVIGPVLGGALVAISWHWVFWFNVPFALPAAAGPRWFCASWPGATRTAAFDALGTITFLIGLTGLVLGISKGGISGWDNPLVIGGLHRRRDLAAAFVADRAPRPRADARPHIFQNRLFAAASAAAFINGLSRFALMFVFVFYFQGVQGDSPILAGHQARAAGARDAGRLAARRASTPTAAGRAGWRRWGCS